LEKKKKLMHVFHPIAGHPFSFTWWS